MSDLKFEFSQIVKFLRWLTVLSITSALAFGGTVFAQDEDEDDEDDVSHFQEFLNQTKIKSLNRQNIDIRLKPLGFGLMGDSIDGYTGRIQFATTDVDLPGNSNLPVRIRRIAKGAGASLSQEFYMADWDIEIPHEYRTRGTTHCICEDWKVYIPGEGSQKIWENGTNPITNASAEIFDEPRWDGQYVGGVTDNHTIQKQGGFVTTDGTYYELGERFTRSAADQNLQPYQNQSGGHVHVTREVEVKLATQVTDVNGNWVKYEYSDDHFLTRIHSNDGREITLDYISADGTKYVSKVTANPNTTDERSWTYEYVSVTDRDRAAQTNRMLLKKVIQPDNKYWEYDLDKLSQRPPSNSDYRGSSGNTTASVTHPYGTKATYVMGVVILDSTPIRDPYNGLVVDQSYIKSDAVYSKTLTLSDGETLKWEYDYGHYGFESEFTPITNNGGNRVVKRPDGTRVQSGYTKWPTAGLLTVQETYPAGSTNPLRRVVNNYEKTSHIFGRDNEIQTSDDSEEEEYEEGFKLLLTQNFVVQDGDTFTTEYEYDTDPWSPSYSYNQPIKKTVYATISGSTTPRVTDIEFEHISDKWILNLTKKATINNREIATFDYDGYGKLTHAYRYGALYMSYGYYGTGGAANSGALEWQEDALGRRTYAYDWKRGTAQRVKYPDDNSDYSYVDDNGWAVSRVDPKGYTTEYEYDDMGRVTLVNPNGAFWDNTEVGYDFTNGGAIQTITKGDSETVVTYDSLFRTVLEKTSATDTSWVSFVNTRYDSMGRVAFKSQPSTDEYEVNGTDISYDGLGRIYEEQENVSPFARTRHRYYSGGRYRVTDPSGAFTQYFSLGYRGPGNKEYRSITKYADGAYTQTTTMYKNVWGELVQLRQSGTHDGISVDQSQYFSYDVRRRLCSHYSPEHGATKYKYNAADEVIYYAKGQPQAGCIVSGSNVSRVNQTYDAMGRLKVTNFVDPTTPDIHRTYDDNGNLMTLNRGTGSDAVNWTYTYNDLNSITSEKLDVDGRGYETAYGYDASGFVTQKTLPGNRVVDYDVDGLGRTLSVQSGGETLASNTDYHADGTLGQMTYGNGQYFSRVLNDRLQTERLLSTSGGNKAIDQTFSYDARGLVTSIIDGAVNNNNRTYSYDGLGHLKTASGPWGAGAYKYDSLGNLREKKLGNRTVVLNYDESRNRVSQSIDTGDSGTRTVAYDTRGNVTTLGNLTFAYDKSDQPVAVSGTANGIGSANGTYRYDGNMKRVKSVMNSGDGTKVIYNIYDSRGSLIQIDKQTEGEVTDYVKGPNGTLARVTYTVNTNTGALGNDKYVYLHPDHLGSAQAGTKGQGYTSADLGKIDWREQYTPFGETLQNAAANDNQGGFTGHIKDKATGLNYMQARYYDPVIGRFLSNDPVTFMDTGNPAMFNRYAYCYNDPVNCIDPDGELGLLGFVLGAGIDLGVQVAKGVASGESLTDAVKGVDVKSVLVSGALGAVGLSGGGLVAGLSGKAVVAGKSVALASKAERIVVGANGLALTAAAGFATTGSLKEGVKDAAVSVVPGGPMVKEAVGEIIDYALEEVEDERESNGNNSDDDDESTPGQ